jgi:hypothetical protein
MIECSFLCCLSQGRPDLKVQCVAWWLRQTAAAEVAGHRVGRAGKARFGRTSRREYLETTRVRDCFDSLGPAAGKRQLSQAKQDSHRLASPKREDARESDRPKGAFHARETDG